MVERLSGWRLVVFLILAVANFGCLGLLVELPLVLNGAWQAIAFAFVAAAHVVFIVFLAGLRFRVSVKFALGAAHAVVCLWAIRNLEATSDILLASIRWLFLLIPAETIVVTLGGVFAARRSGFHEQHRFSVSDLLILVTTFAILFPLVMTVWPQVPLSYFEFNDYLQAGWVAVLCGWWARIIVNFLLTFGGVSASDSDSQRTVGAFSPQQKFVGLATGTFLLTSMLDWNTCQFSLLVALWLALSFVPAIGMAARQADWV